MNTIDLYGDVATLKALLNGELGAFEDDVMDSFDSNSFCYNTSISSISLPNATSVMGRFNYCVNLESINFPKAESMKCSFRYSRLSSVSLPELKHVSENLYSNGYETVAYCYDLASVSFPKLEDVCPQMFYQCSSLLSVNLPCVTSISYSAFSNCTSLQSVSAPSALSIGQAAFSNCYSLQSVSFEALTAIGQSVFNGCSSLVSAEFPSLQQIGSEAFSSCLLLTSLTIGSSSLCTISSTNAFANTPIANGTGHIYVPTSLYSQYITATNWSNFASSITTISS